MDLLTGFCVELLHYLLDSLEGPSSISHLRLRVCDSQSRSNGFIVMSIELGSQCLRDTPNAIYRMEQVLFSGTKHNDWVWLNAQVFILLSCTDMKVEIS